MKSDNKYPMGCGRWFWEVGVWLIVMFGFGLFLFIKISSQ